MTFDLARDFPLESRFEWRGKTMRVVAHADNNWGSKEPVPRLVAIHEGTNDVLSLSLVMAEQIAKQRNEQ